MIDTSKTAQLCFSHDGENFVKSLHLAASRLPWTGDKHENRDLFIGEIHDSQVCDFLNADLALDAARDAAYDQIGEHAEDFLSVTEPQKAMLDGLLDQWAEACSVSADFYEAMNIEVFKVTRTNAGFELLPK